MAAPLPAAGNTRRPSTLTIDPNLDREHLNLDRKQLRAKH
jgi:hypothetical protein